MRKAAQLALPLVEKPKHGGARKGAGRPAKGPIASQPHKRRAVLDRRCPVHVTLRVAHAARYLRNGKLYRAIRAATAVVAEPEQPRRGRRTIRTDRRERFRIVHISAQQGHVHLIVEASNRMTLARGLQAFEVSAARRINRALGRTGPVFPDRYHAHILRTPRETRSALAYVLCNWRKHGLDAVPWDIDPCSSGYLFAGWRERLNSPSSLQPPETWRPPTVSAARTWLLTTGWKRHGLVSVREVPGGVTEGGAKVTEGGAKVRGGG